MTLNQPVDDVHPAQVRCFLLLIWSSSNRNTPWTLCSQVDVVWTRMTVGTQQHLTCCQFHLLRQLTSCQFNF